MYKNIKFFVYVVIVIFAVLAFTLFLSQKSAYEKNKEKEFLNSNIQQVNNNDDVEQQDSNSVESQDEIAQQEENVNNQLQQYVDKSDEVSENATSEGTDTAIDDSSVKNDSVSNGFAGEELVQVDDINVKLPDAPAYKKYKIITSFLVDGATYYVVAKDSDYQSQYSKTVRKRYYVYKAFKNQIKQVYYLADVSILRIYDEDESILDSVAISLNRNMIVFEISGTTKAVRKLGRNALKYMVPSSNNALPIIEVASDSDDDSDVTDSEEDVDDNSDDQSVKSNSTAKSSTKKVNSKTSLVELPEEE